MTFGTQHSNDSLPPPLNYPYRNQGASEQLSAPNVLYLLKLLRVCENYIVRNIRPSGF